MIGEFNGGCTADGCREQPLLAVIVQELTAGVSRARAWASAAFILLQQELLVER